MTQAHTHTRSEVKRRRSPPPQIIGDLRGRMDGRSLALLSQAIVANLVAVVIDDYVAAVGKGKPQNDEAKK